jgi:FixJ family two-component response regulator
LEQVMMLTRVSNGHSPFPTPSTVASQPTTLFVVDDDISMYRSLKTLESKAGWTIEAFASAPDFLNMAQAASIGCVILSASLPNAGESEFHQRLARELPGFPVIFVSACSDVRATVRAMKAGAIEFLTKPVAECVLLAAVEEAVEYSRSIFEMNMTLRKLRADFASLSNRERQVMTLIASGLLNKQVGGKLGISEITVKAHRGQVMRKMKARTFAQLVMMAAKLEVTHAS